MKLKITQQHLILIGLVVAIIFMYMNKKKVLETLDETTCDNQSPSKDQMAELGQTAKDACNRISSKAEEITAHYKGAQGVVDALWGAFSPKNWKAGDNTSTDIMRNIVNNNLSQCEVLKIENDCKNTSNTTQTNIIDNTKCKYCEDNLCEVANVTQENKMKMSQTCLMQSAIETLMKKKNSVDSQALANVLQKTQDLMSGNNVVQKENCNIVNNDMSSAEYMDIRQECANELTMDQNNSMIVCGNATNIVQKNQFESLQKCLQGAQVSSETDIESETKTKQETKIEQESSGLNLLASGASLFSLIIASGAIYFLYDMMESKKKNL